MLPFCKTISNGHEFAFVLNKERYIGTMKQKVKQSTIFSKQLVQPLNSENKQIQTYLTVYRN